MAQESLTGQVKELTFWRASLPALAMVIVNTMAAPINMFIASGTNGSGVESVGTAGSIMMMFGVLLSLLTGGTGILIGQYIGKKRKEGDLKAMTDTAFLLTFIQAAMLAALVFGVAPYLLKAWGVNYNTPQMDDGVMYMRWLAPSWLLIASEGYFLSVTAIYGYPKWSMIVGLSLTGMDMLMSSLFVYAGDFGVFGVILGSILARSWGFVMGMIIYSWKVQRVWKIHKFKWFAAKKLIGISIPIAGEKLNYNVGTFIQGILIGNLAASVGMVVYSHNYMLWCRAIFVSMSSITLIGGVSFSVGLERVMSRKLGEGKIEESKKMVKKAITMAWLLDMSLVGILCIIRNPMMDFLTSKNTPAEVSKLKDELWNSFYLLFLLESGRVFNLIYIAATRSAGDTKFTAMASIPITWITAILLSWVFPKYANLGWMGVVLGMALDESLRGVVNFWRYKSNRWIPFIKKLHTK